MRRSTLDLRATRLLPLHESREDPSLSSMRTGAKVLATLAAAALALSACASDDDGEDGSSSQETTAPITFTWLYAQEFASYNGNTADGNSVANNAILGVTAPSFW